MGPNLPPASLISRCMRVGTVKARLECGILFLWLLSVSAILLGHCDRREEFLFSMAPNEIGFLQAVFEALRQRLGVAVPLKDLGTIVRKATYGFGQNTRIKHLLERDTRLLLLVSGGPGSETVALRPSRKAPGGRVDAVLAQTAADFYSYCLSQHESGLWAQEVPWTRMGAEFHAWASKNSSRGGYDRVMSLLIQAGNVISVRNRRGGRGRGGRKARVPRAFDFEAQPSALPGLPPREQGESAEKEGFSITYPLEFTEAVPLGSRAELAIAVRNDGEHERILHRVSFYGFPHSSNSFGPFELLGEHRDPQTLEVGKPFYMHIIFKPTHLGVSKCVLVFDFGEGVSMLRYVSAQCGSAELHAQLKPTSPYVRKRNARRMSSTGPRRNVVPGEKLTDSGAPFVIKLRHTDVPAEFRERAILGELEADLILTRSCSFLGDRARANQDAKVGVHSYCELFRSLEFLEELQAESDMRAFNLYSVPLQAAVEGLLTLAVPGLAEKRPSVLRGDSVLVMAPARERDDADNRQALEGIVWRVEMDRVALKFGRKVPPHIVDVEFTFKRTQLNLVHQGLGLLRPPSNAGQEHALEHCKCVMSVLSPTLPLTCKAPLIADFQSIAWRAGDLNDVQQAAVKQIFGGKCRPVPFIIYGPPGTGKTRTMVEAIKLRHRHNSSSGHILVCAPSNKAADVLVTRLAKAVPKTEMLRLMSYGRNRRDVTDDVFDFCTFKDGSFQTPELERLVGFRIIVATLAMASKLYNMGVTRQHFGSIFIDECGQCTEPDVLSVLGPLLNFPTDLEQQVVLAGDPQQLGPIIRSSLALKHGLGQSFLERLMSSCPVYQRDLKQYPDSLGYNPSCIVKLLHCYRCHEQILSVPNRLLYDGDLVASGNSVLVDSLLPWSGLPNKRFPLIFHGVEGDNQREGNSPSWFNVSEVELVVSYVLRLKADLSRFAMSLKEIGIITPYQKQVSKIRQALKAKGCEAVDVGSVEQFQGDERRVIILSTVRSSVEYLELDAQYNLGFVASPKRFNVSVTRAQALLIVIGSPKVLSTDPMWSALLAHCADHQACLGAPLPPPRSPDRSDDEDDDDDDGEDAGQGWRQNGARAAGREGQEGQEAADLVALERDIGRLAVHEALGGAWDREE